MKMPASEPGLSGTLGSAQVASQSKKVKNSASKGDATTFAADESCNVSRSHDNSFKVLIEKRDLVLNTKTKQQKFNLVNDNEKIDEA